MPFLDEITRRKDESGMPWAEISRRCGIENSRYFPNLIRDGGAPSLDKAVAAATALGFSLDEACSVPPTTAQATSIDSLISHYIAGQGALSAMERFLPYSDLYRVPKPKDRTLRMKKMGPESLLAQKLKQRNRYHPNEYYLALISKWLLNTRSGRAAVSDYKLAAEIGILVKEVKLDEHLPEEGITVLERYVRILLRCHFPDGEECILTFAKQA